MIKIIKATEEDTEFIKGYYNYPSLITNGTHKNVVGIGTNDQYKISKNGDNVELLSWNSGMGYIAIALYSNDLRLL